MIGNVVRKSGASEPKFSKFSEIRKGDLIFYYATKDMVVTGIFEVVSDMEYLPNDLYWKEIMVYKTKPVELPVPGNYLDFKKLVADPNVQFDMFPKKKRWGRYLQGQTCKLLTERDYVLIRDGMADRRYLRSIKEIEVKDTRWHRKYAKGLQKIKKPKVGRHQEAIEKWKLEEEKKFGLFKPDIKTNTVDINEVLPKGVWLKENTKYVDGLARLEIGGQPIYQSILEVHERGSREDLCVHACMHRVSIVLPFVTRVDIVSDEDNLRKIGELLERIADPNIVKSRVKSYPFTEFFQ